MIINDLLRLCNINDVLVKISLHYGSTELKKYEKLYNDLLSKKPIECEEKTFIHINAYYEGDEEDTLLKIFDENDASMVFDVSAFVEDDNMIYSISSSSYAEFLGYSVDDETLNNYSKENILAHCLYEITAYTFDDND